MFLGSVGLKRDEFIYIKTNYLLSSQMYAIKSIKQTYQPNLELESMMVIFKEMVNQCIRTGLENNVSTS